MPYVEEKVIAGATLEINKYYSIRYHSRGEKRAKKEKESSDSQKKVNKRKAVKELATDFSKLEFVDIIAFRNREELTELQQKKGGAE